MRQIRNALPSAAIVIPILVAIGLAVFATEMIGVIAGALVGVGAAFAAALVIESPLKQLAAVTRRIAEGDRYAIVPRRSGGGSKSFSSIPSSWQTATVPTKARLMTSSSWESNSCWAWSKDVMATSECFGWSAVSELVSFTGANRLVSTDDAERLDVVFRTTKRLVHRTIGHVDALAREWAICGNFLHCVGETGSSLRKERAALSRAK